MYMNACICIWMHVYVYEASSACSLGWVLPLQSAGRVSWHTVYVCIDWSAPTRLYPFQRPARARARTCELTNMRIRIYLHECACNNVHTYACIILRTHMSLTSSMCRDDTCMIPTSVYKSNLRKSQVYVRTYIHMVKTPFKNWARHADGVARGLNHMRMTRGRNQMRYYAEFVWKNKNVTHHRAMYVCMYACINVSTNVCMCVYVCQCFEQNEMGSEC